MATMKDIARLARVSTSTVSHVINNSRYVSDEIRQKVMAVVESLNYQPSAVARSLKVKETRTLGMLVTTSDNPFFAELIDKIEHYCSQHNYTLMLCSTAGKDERIQETLQVLLQKQVDGLFLMCAEPNVKAQLPKLTLPTVIMDWWPTNLNADLISEDSHLGSKIATEHLIFQGHRKIGMITGELEKFLARQRLQAFKETLEQHNLPLVDDWIIASDFTFEGGVRGMRELLKSPTLPTAIFACNDAIALGAYQVAQEFGLKIPEDLSIIGYDDITIAKYLHPSLSTINQPKQQLAQLAVDTLLERIKNPQLPYRTLKISPTLTIRSSVKNLNAEP